MMYLARTLSWEGSAVSSACTGAHGGHLLTIGTVQPQDVPYRQRLAREERNRTVEILGFQLADPRDGLPMNELVPGCKGFDRAR